MLPRHVRAVQLLAPLLLLGALFAPTAPASAGAVDPFVGAPEKGDCFAITAAQADAESFEEEPVACRSQHTLWITDVVLIPGTDPIDPTSSALQRQILTQCYDARDTAIGSNLSRFGRSVYQVVFFVPTRAQRDAGARWASCGLVLLQGTRLVSTTAAKPARLSTDKVPGALALCVDRRIRAVPCAQPHYAKVKTSHNLRGSQASVDAAGRVADRVCTRKRGRAYVAWYFRTTDVSGDSTRGLLSCLVRG